MKCLKELTSFFKEVNNIINEKSLMRKIIALSCGKQFSAFLRRYFVKQQLQITGFAI